MNSNKLMELTRLIKNEKGQIWMCKINRNRAGTRMRWVISLLEDENMGNKSILKDLIRAMESVQKENRDSEIWVCKIVPNGKGKEKWVCSLVKGNKSSSLKAPKKQ